MIERMAQGDIRQIQQATSLPRENGVDQQQIVRNGKVSLGSYWGAGYDSPAFEVEAENGDLKRHDILAVSQHDRFVAEDYALLQQGSISWTREDARWHLQTDPDQYNFSHLDQMLNAGREFGIQQVWSLSHYSRPDFIDPFTPDFPQRFSDYGLAFLEYLEKQGRENPTIIPINEPSFWAHMIDSNFWHTSSDRDFPRNTFKGKLIEAHKRFYDNAKKRYPEVNILACDPSYYVVAADDHPRVLANVEAWQDIPFSAIDDLKDYVDIIGINYYQAGQVERYIDPVTQAMMTRELPDDDPRRLSLYQSIQRFYTRYPTKAFLLTETSRVESKLLWLRTISRDLIKAIQAGISILGACWYPFIDQPDWDSVEQGGRLEINPCGIIHLRENASGILERSSDNRLISEIRQHEAAIQNVLFEAMHN